MRTPLGGLMPNAWRWKCSQDVSQPLRQHAVTQDLPVAVDVGEERLQRTYPLSDTPLDLRPLVRRDHPRQQVERERPFLPAQ